MYFFICLECLQQDFFFLFAGAAVAAHGHGSDRRGTFGGRGWKLVTLGLLVDEGFLGVKKFPGLLRGCSYPGDLRRGTTPSVRKPLSLFFMYCNWLYTTSETKSRPMAMMNWRVDEAIAKQGKILSGAGRGGANGEAWPNPCEIDRRGRCRR